MQLSYDALYVEDDLGNVFLYSGDGRDLMENSVYLDAGYSISGKRGKKHSAKRVSEGRAVSALKRLYGKTSRLRVVVFVFNGYIGFLYFDHDNPPIKSIFHLPKNCRFLRGSFKPNVHII